MRSSTGGQGPSTAQKSPVRSPDLGRLILAVVMLFWALVLWDTLSYWS